MLVEITGFNLYLARRRRQFKERLHKVHPCVDCCFGSSDSLEILISCSFAGLTKQIFVLNIFRQSKHKNRSIIVFLFLWSPGDNGLDLCEESLDLCEISQRSKITWSCQWDLSQIKAIIICRSQNNLIQKWNVSENKWRPWKKTMPHLNRKTSCFFYL